MNGSVELRNYVLRSCRALKDIEHDSEVFGLTDATAVLIEYVGISVERVSRNSNYN